MCGCFAASALCIWRCFTIGKLEHQINEEIRDKELRVIGADGSQLGIMTSSDALALAEEKDLDLVKIAPNAVPPVCKIMDYGKFRFEQLKKEKEAKKNQKVVEIKEIRMSPSIDTNDFNTKVKSAVKFLNDGNRVKVTVRFRGREMAHTSLGQELLAKFGAECSEIATIAKDAKLEGRNMSMFLIQPHQERQGQESSRIQEPYPHQEDHQAYPQSAQERLRRRDRGRYREEDDPLQIIGKG